MSPFEFRLALGTVAHVVKEVICIEAELLGALCGSAT